MRRVVRLVLTWLLALALPVQGVAAATTAACSTRHVIHAAATAHAASRGIDHGAHDTHRHDAATAPANDARAQPVHAATKVSDDSVHKCSACASCCLNAVVATETLAFDTIAHADRFAPLVTTGPVAYVTEGQERPPRTFLA